jgi:hypothetical protein
MVEANLVFVIPILALDLNILIAYSVSPYLPDVSQDRFRIYHKNLL